MGTDFSKVALDYVARHRDRLDLQQVALDRRWADDFAGIADDSLDAIVLNSIILDFPSMDYLMEVLEGSVKAVRSGGMIFVGDVRCLPLIETYQTSVQLFQAADDLPVEQVQSRVQRLIRQEEELVIDPRFFAWLAQRLDGIGRVQIQLKRGSFTNELNAFRYDVTLYVGDTATVPTVPAKTLKGWDWGDEADAQHVEECLRDQRPEVLVVRDVPNARVRRDVAAVQAIAEGTATTSGEVRAATAAVTGINPEDLWTLADELGYAADIRWAASGAPDRFDVAFVQPAADGSLPTILFPDETGLAVDASLPATAFANNPMMGKLSRQLGPELRQHLTRQLPDYMVPAVYVPMDELPLSPNGKVDRKRLPDPDTSRPDIESAYVAPQGPVESLVTEIWADVLGLDRVGADDAFLDLGGHSLSAVQIQARLGEIFPFDIALPDIFESRTVARLAALITAKGTAAGVDASEICRMLREIDAMSDEEVQSRIGGSAEE